MHLLYVKDKEGAHLLYKGGHNKICALWGTKEDTFVLQLILANTNNTKFNYIGLGLSPSLCQGNILSWGVKGRDVT